MSQSSKPNKSDKAQFNCQVDTELLEAFKRACEGTDTTASQSVRSHMREYVRKHGQIKLL